MSSRDDRRASSSQMERIRTCWPGFTIVYLAISSQPGMGEMVAVRKHKGRCLDRGRGLLKYEEVFKRAELRRPGGTGGLCPHWTVREKGSAAWSLISKTFVLLRDNSPSTGLSREWKIVPHCTSAAALVFHVVNGDRGVVENALCTQCRTAPGER